MIKWRMKPWKITPLLIRKSQVPFLNLPLFWTAHSVSLSFSLSLKDRIDKQHVYNMHTHKAMHTEQIYVRTCWRTSCQLILLNKIPPSTYLIFSPFQLQGPLYLSYSAIQHEQLPPPLFACIFFPPPLSLSLSFPKDMSCYCTVITPRLQGHI